MSIYSKLLDQNGHTFARIGYRPEYSASKPYISFYNGTALLHHETLYDAKLYLQNRMGVRMKSWPLDSELSPEKRKEMGL
jgi:hypothetical protein